MKSDLSKSLTGKQEKPEFELVESVLNPAQ